MTGTQDKVRSLFLTALMIGSVFAGTIALAGTAAAATNTSYGITNAGDNNRYLTSNPGNTYTTSGTVEFSGNPTVAETEVVIENADLGAVQPGDITVTVAGTPYTLQSGEVDIGTDEFTVDWSALRNRVGAIDIQDGDTVQFTVLDVQNPDEAGRHDFQVTHFDSEGNSLDNYRKQLKIADENLAGGRFWQGQQLHIGYGGAQTLELYEVERNSSGARIITSSGFVAEINIDGSGNGLINTNNLEGEYAIADANQNIQDIQAGGTVVAGGTLQGGADTFTVSVQSLSAAFDSNTVAVGEQVDIEFTSNRNVFNVTVSADGLGTDELADIFSSAGIVSQDDDENEVTFHVDGDQVVTTDFTDIDTGEYTFDFQVADTAASATSTITVQEEADAEATVGVGGVARARVGDIARVPIQLTNTDNARVNLGFNNVNFNLTLEIQDGNDDGQAGFDLNLYTLGRDYGTPATNANADVQGIQPIDDSDSVSVIDVNGSIAEPPLDAAAYDINVTLDGNELTVGTLQITSPRLQGVQSYTAPESLFGEYDDDELGEFYNAMNSGEVTRSNQVAKEDTLVYKIQTSSVYGALEAEESVLDNTEDTTQAFVNLFNATGSVVPGTEADFEFFLHQTNPGPNQYAKTLAINQTYNNNGIQVLKDQRNESVWVLLDTDALRFTRVDSAEDQNTYYNAGNAPTANYPSSAGTNFLSAKTGDRYNASFTFRSTEDDDYDFAGSEVDSDITEDTRTFGDTASIVQRSLEFNTDEGDVISVDAAANQVISGTTTVAPGTELNIRIRSTGATPFLEDPTAIVQPDGSFNVTVDFSMRAPNTSFEATARSFDDDDVLTPGIIGEAATASVTFDDQQLQDGTVTVDRVTLSEGGYVVIHDAAGAVIGHSGYLENGTTGDVSVALDEVPSENTTLTAMAHLDTNGNEVYDFPDADGPYTTAAGDPVTDTANITVDMATPTTPTDTPTDTPTATPTDTPTATPTTTAAQGPGFTAVLSVLALLGAALIAARRRD